jgi:hypothetical protein
MVEIGKFKSVAPNASMEGLLTENTALKKREANLKLVIAVGVIAALGYYYYKSKKKEIRIVDPESDNLNTSKDEKFY